MKKLIIILLFFNLHSSGQTFFDIKFIKHLSDTEAFQECIFEAKRYDFKFLSNSLADSLFYYKGWSEYSLKKLEDSANTLLKVSAKSSFYTKSRLFAAYNYSHIGMYSKVLPILNNLPENDIVLFQKAGLSLLQRDFGSFDTYIGRVDTKKYFLNNQSHQLLNCSKVLRNHNYKSPLLAASLSTLVPGLGKIYAGKIGDGISSFIGCSALGLVTWEQYRKNGFNDCRTILSAALFSLFYGGNIWGSYFTVLISENEFDDEYNNKILFNIHIPLRTVFN